MKRQKQIRSNWMFCICATVTAAACGLGLMNAKPVMAAESAGEEMVVSKMNVDVSADVGVDTTGELSENSWGGVSKSRNASGDENLGVYDFKDNKTTGTVTVTKVWDDDKTNEERVIPDIKISTAKPSKSTLGYTVTFHGSKDIGLVFDDGSDVNEVVYNSSGQIVDGLFKVPKGWEANAVAWFTDKALTNKVDVNESGTVQMTLSGDVDLWGRVKTFEVKGYKYGVKNDNEFNALVPDTVTEILFTDEIKPAEAEIIDVDADGDCGVVAWTENDGVVMKISTQIKGMKVHAARDSGYMFYDRSKLTNIDFSMLDTQNVTDMGCMFRECSSLSGLNISSFDTQNVTNMSGMFMDCKSLKELDISSFNMNNVNEISDATYGSYGRGAMFKDCYSLTYINMPKSGRIKVKNYCQLFDSCKSLMTIDLTVFDTSIVTNMSFMFYNCSGLTTLDLTSLNTQNVVNMMYMFRECSNLTSLTTGPNFKFVGTNYSLAGTWQNTAGETFTSGNFPSNVADTYTKIK